MDGLSSVLVVGLMLLGSGCSPAASTAATSALPAAADGSRLTGAGEVVRVQRFVLAGKVTDSGSGVPLAQVIKVFGQPTGKVPSPHDCGSAFNEGEIQQYTYPGFELETDGRTAIIRSMRMGGGNTIVLSNGQALADVPEADFKQAFGARAEKLDEFYRTSATPGGEWEFTYDFRFERGRLRQVDYWIGC